MQDLQTSVGAILCIVFYWKSQGASTLANRPAADACDNQPYSRVRWRGPRANDGSILASRVVVPQYSECMQNNVRFIEKGAVFHETGGSVVRTTLAFSQLW
jgi:hypothetical protein